MKRRLVFFAITAVIAMLIVMLINGALRTKQATIEALQHDRVEIVVAARDLSPGSVLDATSLRMVAWPRDSLPPGAFGDAHQLAGEVVKQSVIQNQPIVAQMLLERGKTGGVLPFLITNGMRAMSIPVTPVSDMAGMILPHTRVDVLVTSSEPGGTSERTRIVLQNVEVLAAQTTLDASSSEPQRAEVVTLLVTPSDAERLAAAIRLGTIQLAMRSYVDQQSVWTAGIDSHELLGEPASLTAQQPPPAVIPARTAPMPKPQISIEIIRNGKQRETVSFTRTRRFAANPEMSSIIDPPGAGDGQAATAAK
jgi:pilus assembly protein CpaB